MIMNELLPKPNINELLQEPEPVWTLESALEWLRPIDAKLREVGAFTAITGGCMYRGHSHKDLDVVVMNLDTEPGMNKSAAVLCLKMLGLKRVQDAKKVRKYQKRAGGKDVEVWSLPDGRRVDFFFYL